MKVGEGECDISFTWAKTGQYVKTAAICCTPVMPGTLLKGLLNKQGDTIWVRNFSEVQSS